MTIAVGFRCVDGVVLAADSLYTDGPAKLYGPKIFPIPSNGLYAMTVAGAGGVPSLKAIVQDIRGRLKRYTGPPDFAGLQRLIEAALCAYYPKHIDSAPRDKQDDLSVSLLIAIWTVSEGARLFESCRTTVFEVTEHRCIGVGSYLAAYLDDVFCPNSVWPNVVLGEALASYIVGRSRKFVQFCGGRTFVRALLDDGTDERVWAEEIREAERYFDGFFTDTGQTLKMLAAMPNPEDIDMSPFAESLKRRMIQLRSVRQECRGKMAETRRRSRGLPRQGGDG